MARKYATCNIVISPTLEVKATRRRMAKVEMNIVTSQTVNALTPLTLVIKGKNFQHVMKLMTLYSKPDEEIVKIVRGSVLASEVEGKTEQEIAAWVRNNVRAELAEMAGGEAE